MEHNKILNFTPGNTYPAPSHKTSVNGEQRTPLLQYNNQGGHTTWYPRHLCLTVHHPPMSKLAQVNKATSFISLLNVDHHATIYLLQDEGMEYSQHTTQSQQLVSEKIFSTSVHHFASGPHWSPMQQPPGKGGIQWNSKKHQTREEAQLLAAPPMHQIQPNGSIKDYLRHTDVNIEHKPKTSKKKHSEGWSKKKHRSVRKLYYCKSITLYFAFMNIVLEIQIAITALPKF